MLANGGERAGKHILAPATIKLMASNHLPPNLLTGEFGIGQHILRTGFGYGFNCAVVFDLAEAGLADGKGTFFWDGAAGMWFRVDPANDVVFVAMIQRMSNPDNHNLQYRGHATVYQALADPSTVPRGLETALRGGRRKWPTGRRPMRSIDLGLPPMLRVNTQFLTFFGRR